LRYAPCQKAFGAGIHLRLSKFDAKMQRIVFIAYLLVPWFVNGNFCLNLFPQTLQKKQGGLDNGTGTKVEHCILVLFRLSPYEVPHADTQTKGAAAFDSRSPDG
jgi:hypothetical protein